MEHLVVRSDELICADGEPDEMEALRREIAVLRQELDRLHHLQNQLETMDDEDFDRDLRVHEQGNIYVYRDDADEAVAFDEFYTAYDEIHAKTRKFLLG
ncbi:MAG: hypothetical protein GY724_00520 [Actinomycetia bacterium]|nr:hypothetical protein [Actinomycetes bacterium]MCP4227821.1 hypothetical protein [Actinomycetes bacterium]MCP5032650.1 hypothetical protein [Actinomycetes bacterium]